MDKRGPALASDKYYVPYRNSKDQDYWWVMSQEDEMILTITTPFRFTIKGSESDVEHYTFEIDGVSVKANGRTLRKLGADKAAKVISRIVSNNVINLDSGVKVNKVDGLPHIWMLDPSQKLALLQREAEKREQLEKQSRGVKRYF